MNEVIKPDIISRPHKVYSGDQALFTQWDSAIKLAGFQKHLPPGEESSPQVVHTFHLIDTLGKANDGDPTVHTTNEFYQVRGGKEVKPAWFAVTDVMPFPTLEYQEPHGIFQFTGKKLDAFTQEVEATFSTFSDEEAANLQQALGELGYPADVPVTQNDVYRTLTEGNWKGIVDNGDRSASAYTYGEIGGPQQELLVSLYKDLRTVVPPSERPALRERIRKVAGQDGLIGEVLQADTPLPVVAEKSFKNVAAEVDRITGSNLQETLLAESTDYFRLPENGEETEAGDTEDERFKVFNWYMGNRDLYNSAHNEVSRALSRAGENPIGAIEAQKGETPFWVVVNGQKYKLVLSDQVELDKVGDPDNREKIPLNKPVQDHRDLAKVLHDKFPGQKVSLAPTAIPLLLQFRSNGDVLLPERGSSYTKQVDKVWDHIIKKGTPKAVKDLSQNAIIRTHPNTLDALPNGKKIKLPWYAARGFETDDAGFVDTTQLKTKWRDVATDREHTIEKVQDEQTLLGKARLAFKGIDAPTVQEIIGNLEAGKAIEQALKAQRAEVMEVAKKSLDKKDMSKMGQIRNYLEGKTDTLPDIPALAGMTEQIDTLRAQTVEFMGQDALLRNGETTLQYLLALRYKELSGGAEAFSYLNARPSLLTLYAVFGEEVVKNIADTTEAYVEEPKAEHAPTPHAYDVDGNKLLLFNDTKGVFVKSGEAKKQWEEQLQAQLTRDQLHTAIIATQPDGDIADMKMLVLEKDGSYSNFCGNAARLIGAVYDSVLKNRDLIVENVQGSMIHISKKESKLLVQLPMQQFDVDTEQSQYLKSLAPQLPIGDIALYTSADEPHMVVEVDLPYEDGDDPLASLDQLRKSAHAIQSAFDEVGGVNINFVLKSTRPTVAVYERGVNDFTGSCGTGSASVATYLGMIDGDVQFISAEGTKKLHVRTDQGNAYLVNGLSLNDNEIN
jgi:diaminopimelate epimerase